MKIVDLLNCSRDKKITLILSWKVIAKNSESEYL